jgi:hypothetical protein
MRGAVLGLALLAAGGAAAAGLEAISGSDAASGLRQALSEGSIAAVARLGVRDGFYGDPRVRIPLPPSLQRIEGAMRFMGVQREADELVLAMNRAAESAVPEARALLLDAVRKMTVEDAKRILTAGETAATDHFRRTTEARLAQRFLPIVKRATDRVGLAQRYGALAGRAAALGLVREEQATIESYVTRKALEALYFTIGEQERAFRRDPLAASSEIVRKVFGALR